LLELALEAPAVTTEAEEEALYWVRTGVRAALDFANWRANVEVAWASTDRKFLLRLV
jgi:hypothetical protein